MMDLEKWTSNPRPVDGVHKWTKGLRGSVVKTFECLLDVLRWKKWQGQQFANKLFATNTHVLLTKQYVMPL